MDGEAADLGRAGVGGGVREVSGWQSWGRNLPVVEPGRERAVVDSSKGRQHSCAGPG